MDGGFSGTSSATAHTAGTIALLLSANPDLEPADISRILQTTAVAKGTPGKDNRYGSGRIDAYQAWLKAVEEISNPYNPRPNKPQKFTAYSDYHTPASIQLNWDPPHFYDNGDSLFSNRFKIIIMRDDVVSDSVAGTVVSYIDSALTDGQLYHYSIFAKDSITQATSLEAKAEWYAGGSPFPGMPINPSISGATSHVGISWQNAAKNEDGTPLDDLAGIRLYRDSNLVAEFIRSEIDTAQADSLFFIPARAGYYQWNIATVDSENPSNESAWSEALQTPLQLPFADGFSHPGIPDPVFWTSYDVLIDDRPLDTPSSPYALNLNGTPHNDDWIELNTVDLSDDQDQGVVFAYSYQPQGTSEDGPESDDSLRIHFRNSLDQWILVKSYSGSDVVPFEQEIIDIETAPAGGGDYFHDRFQVRFDVVATFHWVLPRDDWFVDNVFLGVPAPAIAVSADSLNFDSKYVSGTDSLILNIYNVGLETLHIDQITINNPKFSVAQTSGEIMAGGTFLLAVLFSPSDQSPQNAVLKIAHNAKNRDTVYVSLNSNNIILGIEQKGKLPLVYKVEPNFPNPFNPNTTISYQLPEKSAVKLTVYNTAGQKITTLINEEKPAGQYSAVWRGFNNVGQQVSSGIYFYVFEAANYRKVQKMLLLK